MRFSGVHGRYMPRCGLKNLCGLYLVLLFQHAGYRSSSKTWCKLDLFVGASVSLQIDDVKTEIYGSHATSFSLFELPIPVNM